MKFCANRDIHYYTNSAPNLISTILQHTENQYTSVLQIPLSQFIHSVLDVNQTLKDVLVHMASQNFGTLQNLVQNINHQSSKWFKEMLSNCGQQFVSGFLFALEIVDVVCTLFYTMTFL